MAKKIVFLLVILTSLTIFYGLGRQIYDSLQSGKRLDQAAGEVAELQQKNLELKRRLEKTQSISFVEEQARDKLNLTRPDETVVIIPQQDIDSVLGEKKSAEPQIQIPNWLGWIKLFWR